MRRTERRRHCASCGANAKNPEHLTWSSMVAGIEVPFTMDDSATVAVLYLRKHNKVDE